MIEKKELIEIGKFQKTHALKGELNAVLNIDPEYVEEGNPLIIETDGIPVPFYAESIRPKGASSYLIKLEGVDSVEEADELVNNLIFAPRKDVEDYMGEELLLGDDLEGYRVVDKDLGEIGVLESIDSSTENELFVVRTPDDEEVYIPIVDDFIVDIDQENGIINTSLPEGLVDLNVKGE
ncbi:MAG: ribosome maturation factor RimM [Muribaculaceae bacterium]|nr:16S rRNA processing protein RimM [Bacteroides sp.]MDE6072337.1 ribosome maturation factor RimM [Muribaculaceae bacterium]